VAIGMELVIDPQVSYSFMGSVVGYQPIVEQGNPTTGM
jgi:hypothetical protein